jgi:hypothetical protein
MVDRCDNDATIELYETHKIDWANQKSAQIPLFLRKVTTVLVSQVAIPAPNDGFLPVQPRGSRRSSSQSIRSSQSTSTQVSWIAIQQAIIAASVQNHHALELDTKFDKLDKVENFDHLHRQLRGCLQHEAWQNILGGGEPYVTTAANKTISNKLCQRLNQPMTAAIGEGIGGTDDYEGLGLELLQAIIDHFIPSESVNLPTIFTEWNDLHQKKDALASLFSGRVIKLATRSRRAGQEYTDVSQILTFVDGLHEGFNEFAKDYFSGRVCLAETSLRDTTALLPRRSNSAWTRRSSDTVTQHRAAEDEPDKRVGRPITTPST